MEKYPITEKDKELIALGLETLAKNFDDGVYNHTVGCAVLCKNGNIYKGIHGSCAEYITIGIAISNGELIKVKAIPHEDCVRIATSIFSSDYHICKQMHTRTQEYCRISRTSCAI